MRIIAVFLLMSLMACKVEPEPLQYGQDACHTCKMNLVDKKFGAELVSKKGKVYKFDDVNCMLTYYHSVEVSPEDFAYKLVVDFAQPAKFVEAPDAFYLKSSAIKSPMASQVAAFENKAAMTDFQKEVNGIYLVWGELVTQFKE
ncbi:MAG: nitrous oxide reductase accessory protein NosL [Cyclobacteriaceae bacterium]